MRKWAVAVAMMAMAGPVAHAQWYDGGNLHKADGRAWVKATPANRLATSADFVIGAVGQKRILKLKTMDKVKPYAFAMNVCIDQAFAGPEAYKIYDLKVAEAAAFCYMSMEADWNETLPR